MKILIHGKNLELTGPLKEYTEAKIEKATHHYKDIVKEADIHLSIEKNPRVSFQTAEVTIFANGTIIRAEEKTENLYSSIDLVSNKLCRKLRKYKERHNKKLHNNLVKNKNSYSNAIEESDSIDKDIFNEEREVRLPEPSIKKKYFEMIPISLEEARKQLDFIDHDFYLFRNKLNNELQVIYKRNHGGYGLIQSK
ncbi:light repressed protein A homolog [Prochlorococcus marinus subsp. pastoris str. CCMP1986]|uniref:Ribosome hibernation promoting factor n=1 Tax=Prochlorococcus marinus subsp. pastoris (strain CCMP1986 / NIES-2087 / MED4) TaxID=59919 RepID=Q7V2R9_PROMP|nr:ribosome-associated translation inhibitor RaiA [Prochlorococcus marinus]KGF86257.1 Ribosomal subunit interface protein [Prochlorococcus marinus str. EQPAC1]CAE18859.1 light repressed protein A homolog [Prochlorococcus marinus subsp. pastoris str. CCMP1986]